MELLNSIGKFLYNCFIFDIQVFSKPWIYYTILPALGYLVFFFIKWIVLTAPLWMPVTIIIRVLNLPAPQCRNCLHKTIKEFEQYEVEQTPPMRKEKSHV